MNSPQFPSRFAPSPDSIAHIAALGRHSYSDQAANRLGEYFQGKYGHTFEVSNHANIGQVWGMQNVGSAFLIPLQNSGSGLVKEHWRYIKAIHRDPSLKIVADISMQIQMCLCGIRDIDPNEARRVISHFQGIRQCSNLVGKSDIGGDRKEAPVSLPGTLLNITEHESADSTAEALRTVAERSDHSLLGLGTRESAQENGLQIYNPDSTNLPRNRNITQMLLLQRTHDGASLHPELPYHGLWMALKNQRGALRDFLGPIADSGANITALHKRTMKPDQRKVEFFIELDTSAANNVSEMAESLQGISYLREGPTWQSWSDRVEPSEMVPEDHYDPIEWSGLHGVVSHAGHYKTLMTPKNGPGVLHALLDAMAKNGIDIQTFDSVTIGPKRYAFRLSVSADDPRSMHVVLDQLEKSGILLAMELSAV